MEFFEDHIKTICSCLKDLGISEKTVRIEAVAGDLSPRKYFRLFETTDEFSCFGDVHSIIAMVFESVTPPEVETKIIKTSDIAFLETTDFFLQHGIPVPKIYYKNIEKGLIFLEDLGSRPLIDLVRKQDVSVPQQYEKAVRLIHSIQEILPSSFFIYQRGFDSKTYLREVSLFKEFILPTEMSDKEERIFLHMAEELVSTLLRCQRVLVHRDFHSWNLMVDEQNELRLIDYQDALMGTRSYDLVALLHERDIDAELPKHIIQRLEDSFFEKYTDPYLREIEYPLTQLQRDLKVSGLFKKVQVVRGLDSYARWIPGTVQRIKATLELLRTHNKVYNDFSQLLTDLNI